MLKLSKESQTFFLENDNKNEMEDLKLRNKDLEAQSLVMKTKLKEIGEIREEESKNKTFIQNDLDIERRENQMKQKEINILNQEVK